MLNRCLFLALGFFLFSVSLQAKPGKQRKWRVAYFSYGLPIFYEEQRSKDSIQAAFGLRYRPIAGCCINKRIILRERVRRFRNDIIQFVRFGPGWRRRYEVAMGYDR